MAMEGIGALFSGLAQGAQTGIGLSQNQRRLDLADEQFRANQVLQTQQLDIEKRKFALTEKNTLDQMSDFRAIAGTAQEVAGAAEAEDQLQSILETGKKLGGMSNAVRGPVIDNFAAQWKQQYGADLAPVVIETMKKAKPEELTAMFTALEQQVASDPGMQAGTLIKTLSDPAAATTAIMDLANQANAVNTETTAGGAGGVMQNVQKMRIQRQIENVNAQLSRIQQVKGQMRSVEGLKQLTTMEQKLQANAIALEKELRADTTETVDLGDRVETRDRTSGAVLRTDRKGLAPQAPSDRKVMVGLNPETGEILNQNIIVDPDTGRMMLADGSPVPAGYIATNSMAQGTPAELTTRAKGEVETQILAMDDSLANLEKVVAEFDPKYLQVGPNVEAALKGGLERLGMDLPQQDKDMVAKFSTYKQDAIQVVNEGIKAQTGAAMTEGEAKRITKQFANVEKDSPTQFISKAKNSLHKLKMAKARRQWMLKNGMQFDFKSSASPPVSLDGFEAMIDKRGAEVEMEIRESNPGIGQGEIDAQVDQMLREEFGL